jgi:hypothetical protein
MCQQMTHCYAGGLRFVGEPKPGQVPARGRIEVDFPGLYKLHHCESTKWLAHGPEQKWGLGPNRALVQVSSAVTTGIYRAVSFHNSDGHTRRVRVPHQGPDSVVDCSYVKSKHL